MLARLRSLSLHWFFMSPFESPFSYDTCLGELPFSTDGTFAWLIETNSHAEWTIGERCRSLLCSQLNSLILSSAKLRFELPPEFANFIRTTEWHNHLRSVSGCYLNVAESALPFEKGFLIRFLHDQQEFAFWYLYLTADGADHCVVSSLKFFDDAEGSANGAIHITS